MAPTWVVATGEKEAYESAGAKHVIEGGGLMESRNLALDIAFDKGKACVQMPDDITKNPNIKPFH